MKQIFLIGPPNSGKTSLFNWLTGFKNKVVNYPGSTVFISKGELLKKYDLPAIAVDSPGTYSLNPQSEDEIITVKALSKNKKNQILVLVLDASKLEIQLPLYFQLKKQGFKPIIALTMLDFIKKEDQPNIQTLSQLLGCELFPIKGHTGEGVLNLVSAIKKPIKYVQSDFLKLKKSDQENLVSILNYCKNIVRQSIKKPLTTKPLEKENIFYSKKWDRFFLHPYLGFFFFFGIMFALFSSVFWLAVPFMDGVDSIFSFLMDKSHNLLSSAFPKTADFVSNGLIAGFGAVLIFVPQVFILFVGISFLEDSGYLARAVALVDGPFSKVGLSGRSFVSFLSGYACAIPAILLAKNLSSRREKLLVFFSIPFMSCSARLPVYTLLLSFLFYGASPWKAGLSLTIIYIGSFVLGFLAVFILNQVIKKEKESSSFLLDLPVYRRPSLLKILNRAFRQSQHYITKAGPPIFFVALVLWVLTHYPSNPELSDAERVSQSYSAHIGRFLEPVFELMGLDWRVGVALICAFAAREIFVSALLLVFMVTKTKGDVLMHSLLETMKTATHIDASPLFTTSSVFALIVFFMFSLQCLSTSAVIYKESGSLKMATTQFFALNILAYIMAVGSYQILELIF